MYCMGEKLLYSCLSFNLALNGAQHCNYTTVILLQSGQHHLDSDRETQPRNVSQLAIGYEGEVVIKCGPLAGQGFFWSEDSEAAQYSRNIRVSTNGLPTNQSCSITHCKTVFLVHVSINESRGTARCCSIQHSRRCSH